MAHEVTIIERAHFDYTARCRCGWTSDPRNVYRTYQQAEDQVLKHDRMVERARHHLGPKNPSLKSQHAYYQAQADNPEVPEQDRELWRQLADGLASRLGLGLVVGEQAELISIESVKR